MDKSREIFKIKGRLAKTAFPFIKRRRNRKGYETIREKQRSTQDTNLKPIKGWKRQSFRYVYNRSERPCKQDANLHGTR